MPGTISSGGNILYSWMIAPVLTPASVNANTTAEQSFTIKGLLPTDFVDVYSNTAQTAGIGIVNNRVSAADTLQIGFANTTAGGLTPVSGTYFVVICRPENPNSLPTSAV